MAKDLSKKLTALRESLVKKGFKPERIEAIGREGIEQNSLPSAGKFVFNEELHALHNEANPQMDHIRIGVVGMEDTISMSRIKIQAPKVGQPIKFRRWTKGDRSGVMLQGSPVNPSLSKYAQDELALFLDGKSFVAEEITVNTLPYKEGGWDTASEEDVVSKTAYKITLS